MWEESIPAQTGALTGVQPAAQSWRIQSLLRLMVPYHRSATIEHGIAVTRDVLAATTALARKRGASALVVVPQFGPESAPQGELRRRVLTGLDAPSLVIAVDPSWRLPWDRHPGARAAHAIAVAIANRLRGRYRWAVASGWWPVASR